MSITTLLNNSDLFVEKSLQFQGDNINIEQIPLPISDAKFGILKLTAISAPMSQDVNEFIFMVDRSGSMSDMCSDGRDKMQHILHTLKNMIIYFKDNKSARVYVNIFAFDDKIEEIVARTDINEENIDEIIVKINKISPRNSTDIEKALISIKCTIDKIQLKNPTHNISNIFMTDGEASAGNFDISYLSGLVDRNINNAFIGFGLEHDAVLLKTVSNGDNSSYYFIDKLENAGLVYGEILHGILYKILNDVTIQCSNCLIYDYKNNIWCDSLKVVDIVSESNKVYHIVSTMPKDCRVYLKAKSNKHDSIAQHGFFIFNKDEPVDLSKYVFRQRTLQLLYKINKFIEKKNSSCRGLNIFRGFGNSTNNSSIMEEQNMLKTELKNFMDEMKKYMTDNNLNNDGFMKNLCDDIYISYRTFNTKFGAMYNASRQSSQGTQRVYTVSHTPDVISSGNNRGLRRPVLTRQTNAPTVNLWGSTPTVSPFDNLDTDDLSENELEISVDDMSHVVSNFEDSPYITPTATQVMREISTGTTCDIFAQSKNYISDDSDTDIDQEENN
jgi:AraC-like DNA-binding protein